MREGLAGCTRRRRGDRPEVPAGSRQWERIASMKRTWRAVLVAGAVSAVAVLGFAGAADAHVTVNPDSATQGGEARIAFRVPTESDTASTTKLEVNLPTDQPVA